MSLILSLYANAGVLHEVNHIHRNTTHLFWQAPFSLDLTNADPDIVYCVEVYNITCGRSLLISECDVMETSYTNDALLPGYIYEYTVTPRSNVEGASNGTRKNVTGIVGKGCLKSASYAYMYFQRCFLCGDCLLEGMN